MPAQAADPTVFFAVSPNSISMPQGGGFNISVVISSGGVNVPGGSFIVNYDHSLFAIATYAPAAPWNVTLTNPATGNFSFSLASRNASSDSGPIVAINFKQISGTTFSNSKANVQDPAIRSAAADRLEH
ncbi:MAG: hypothetical protein WCK39_00310, partial [Methanomassiliicoccales archaeon]